MLSASSSNSATFFVISCCCVCSVLTCCCNFFIFVALTIFSTKGNCFISIFNWFTSASTMHKSSMTFSNSESSRSDTQAWDTWSTTLAHTSFAYSTFFEVSIVAFLLCSNTFRGVLGCTYSSSSMKFFWSATAISPIQVYLASATIYDVIPASVKFM